MPKKPDKICDRCAKPTSAAGGRCAACRKQGELCSSCGVNWTGQAKGPLCGDCSYKARGEEEIALGLKDRCACGKAKKKEFKVCYDCFSREKPDLCLKCGARLAAGQPCTRDHRKPWDRPEWKSRRAELVARTSACEWCRDTFTPPKNPPTIVHLNTNRASGLDREAMFQEYMRMDDEAVRVACKRCAFIYRRYGIAGRKDPQVVCPKCGEFKQPRYPLCYDCAEGTPAASKGWRLID